MVMRMEGDFGKTLADIILLENARVLSLEDPRDKVGVCQCKHCVMAA